MRARVRRLLLGTAAMLVVVLLSSGSMSAFAVAAPETTSDRAAPRQYDVPGSAIAPAAVRPTPSLALTGDGTSRGSAVPGVMSTRVLPRSMAPLKTDGFEGTFPGEWQAEGNPTWGATTYKSYEGTHSAHCVGGGTAGQSAPGYPDNANSWLVYGPFDLSTKTAARVLFNDWVDTEDDYDTLGIYASVNGTNYYGSRTSGYSCGWRSINFDLTNVYGLGNLCGRSQVWIAFIFKSDDSFCGNDEGFEGAYIDNVRIEAGLATPSGTMSVSGGAAFVTTTTVTVDSTMTGASQMRVRNAAEGWSEWETYSATKVWNLPEGDGTKTVEAEYRNADGDTVARTDTVTLDSAAPSGTMSINADATLTVTAAVTINSSVTDTSAVNMRFRDVGGAWSDWEVYSAAKHWTLPLGDGTKTIQAEYRDEAGNVRTLADSIVFDTGTTFSLSADRPLVAYNTLAYLRGRLTDKAGTVLVRRDDLTVWARPAAGTLWSQVATASFDSIGGTHNGAPWCGQNTYFQMRFAGDVDHGGSVSNIVLVRVYANLPTPSVSPSSPVHDRTFYVRGYLKPRHSGSTRLHFYRYYRGKWRYLTVKSATNVNYSSYTRYQLSWRPHYPGRYYVQAYHSDLSHAPTWSGKRFFTVR